MAFHRNSWKYASMYANWHGHTHPPLTLEQAVTWLIGSPNQQQCLERMLGYGTMHKYRWQDTNISNSACLFRLRLEVTEELFKIHPEVPVWRGNEPWQWSRALLCARQWLQLSVQAWSKGQCSARSQQGGGCCPLRSSPFIANVSPGTGRCQVFLLALFSVGSWEPCT